MPQTLTALVAGLFALAAVAQNEGAPNVIIFLADDLGVGDLAEDSPLETPSLTRLARRGVTMTTAYASANVCTPARAGLLTGRYPIRSGLAHDVIAAKDERGLPAAELTLAELLSASGYATGMVGKWHLGSEAAFWPTRHGFDHFFGVPHSNDMPDFNLYEGRRVLAAPAAQAGLTTRFTERALQFIRDHRQERFFLYVAYTAPHIPLVPSDAFAGKSASADYGDVVAELDWSVGRIVDALDELNLTDKTLILFTSDNGAWFEGSGGSLRGTKGSTYDAGYRVPMIWSWPGRWPSGESRDTLTSHLDVLPTVLDAAGLALPADTIIDGRRIDLGLKDPGPEDARYFFYFDNEDIVGVRDDRWKLLHRAYYRRSMGALDKFTQLPGFERDYALLFDMQVSRPERYSLASRQPAHLARLTSALMAARKVFDPLRTRPPNPTYPP